MPSRHLLDEVLVEMQDNPEQLDAVHRKGNCVVLAGPGSGKTKTLTAAMARTLLEDVEEPRGVACITYSNECAIELVERLTKLGIEPSPHVFIGTVHSFAMSQIIAPYARCVLPELPGNFRVAGGQECRDAVEIAYQDAIGGPENPHRRWSFAAEKRRRDIDREKPEWLTVNPELAAFILAYEGELHSKGLIDFEDMPLIAYRMIREHRWIVEAINARFPSIFVDEYQDLGHALHGLVEELCLSGGSRVFAVGDIDQSIYAFTGANPELLESLTERDDVNTIRLKLNYRCGTKIISASMAALGEEREYKGFDNTRKGEVRFGGIDGGDKAQAKAVFDHIMPMIAGIPIDRVAILYRTADQGNAVAEAAQTAGVPIVRADNQALVPRNSHLARLTEGCAAWVSGGWRDAKPPFRRLTYNAVMLVYGSNHSEDEFEQIQQELIAFLTESIDQYEFAHDWLSAFKNTLAIPWRKRCRNVGVEWDHLDNMIKRTGPGERDENLPLTHFGGRVEGSGRLTLSTLHSAKGREFDVVVLFGMSNDVIPDWRDNKSPHALREARRLFYVGVTRARHQLFVTYRKGAASPWVLALSDRLKEE